MAAASFNLLNHGTSLLEESRRVIAETEEASPPSTSEGEIYLSALLF